VDPQHSPYGGGPQHGPPPGQPPWAGGPYRGGPPNLPPPPPYGPAGLGPPPPQRRRTGLVVGLVAGGAALVVLAVALVLVFGSRPTRISDLAAVHGVIAADYNQDPFLGVVESDGARTVYVSLYLYDFGGPGTLREESAEVARTVWSTVPGAYDQVAVVLSGYDDPFVQVWDTRALREDFGVRPGGLEPGRTDGRAPTLNRAGECSPEFDYCNEPAEALVTENTRALMERACPLADWEAFPAEPFQIRNHDPDDYGAESSLIYLLSPVTAPDADFLTVTLLGGNDDFLEVTCQVGDDARYETYSRADYEDAVG